RGGQVPGGASSPVPGGVTRSAASSRRAASPSVARQPFIVPVAEPVEEPVATPATGEGPAASVVRTGCGAWALTTSPTTSAAAATPGSDTAATLRWGRAAMRAV